MKKWRIIDNLGIIKHINDKGKIIMLTYGIRKIFKIMEKTFAW